MSESPDRPPVATFATALRVKRNAAVGAAAGVALAAAAYLFRVFELAGPVAATRAFPVLGPAGWFLVLAFVLATATALLVAAALTVVTAIRLVANAESGGVE